MRKLSQNGSRPPVKPSAGRAPAHLSREAGDLWATISEAWILSEDAEVILSLALEAFDRMREAQKCIKKHGIVIEDRWGQLKANPAVLIERDSRAALLSAFRSLELGLEPIRDKIGRPPGT
jgi:P27 family predicted phage terminase small subunit